MKADYDQSIDALKYVFNSVSATDYCVVTSSGKWWAYKHGPSGVITATQTDPSTTCP
jgi:hypothetical protein